MRLLSALPPDFFEIAPLRSVARSHLHKQAPDQPEMERLAQAMHRVLERSPSLGIARKRFVDDDTLGDLSEQIKKWGFHSRAIVAY